MMHNTLFWLTAGVGLPFVWHAKAEVGRQRGEFGVTPAPILTQSTIPLASSTASASYQTCAIDPIYVGMFSNSYIQYDVSTFCLSLLGSPTVTSCLSTSTTRVTVAPTTIVTDTHITTTTIPSSAITITSTITAFDLDLSYMPNTLVPSSPRAYPFRRRAFLNGTLEDAKSSLSSACECNPELSPITDNIICPYTMTISQTTILRTVATVMVTTTYGVTTVTQTSSSTSNIIPAATSTPIPNSAWLSKSTYPTMSEVATACDEDPWDPWTPVQTTEAITTCDEDMWDSWTYWQTTEATTMGDEDSWDDWISWQTTVIEIATSQISSSSTLTPTALPSGCPYSNGTIFEENADKCTFYERVCGRTYDENCFHSFVAGYDTPEQCTALCDALNRGSEKSCLGIVWTTATSAVANCRALRSLDGAISSDTSIALLINALHIPACDPGVITAETISTSRTSILPSAFPISNIASSRSTSADTTTSTRLSSQSTTTTQPYAATTGSSTSLPQLQTSSTQTSGYSYNDSRSRSSSPTSTITPASATAIETSRSSMMYTQKLTSSTSERLSQVSSTKIATSTSTISSLGPYPSSSPSTAHSISTISSSASTLTSIDKSCSPTTIIHTITRAGPAIYKTQTVTVTTTVKSSATKPAKYGWHRYRYQDPKQGRYQQRA